MKSIALFIDVEYGSGGTFQYNQQILEALISLPKNQFELTVFYTDEAWVHLIPRYVKSKKVVYPPFLKKTFKILFGLGMPASLMKFFFLSTPLKKLADPRYHLVFFPSQDLAGLFLSSRSVNVIHDLMHRYESRFKESSGAGRWRFRERLFDSMSKYSSVLLVDSRVGKEQVIESYFTKPSKIEVLPYIAPSHIVCYSDERHSNYFDQLRLPSKFIFYPAQFWPHKNHKILLEATLLLKHEIPDFNLVFTGPPKYEFDNLFEFCKKNDLLKTVHFLDFVPNEVLGGFYLRARALVMPTFYGPTNIPPLEAIAMQCPVAVSNIYGMPEQLGDASLYFNNTDVSDVASVLKSLWNNEQLHNKLKEKSKDHFLNWNRTSFNKRVCEIIVAHSQ